jgi:hypothetical protein
MGEQKAESRCEQVSWVGRKQKSGQGQAETKRRSFTQRLAWRGAKRCKAKRCEAVRSGAKRCEAVRSGAVRCEAVRGEAVRGEAFSLAIGEAFGLAIGRNQAAVVHATLGLTEEQRADDQRSGCNKASLQLLTLAETKRWSFTQRLA